MKKAILSLVLFISFICISLSFSKFSFASSWQKYPNNPVLSGRGAGFWEGIAALDPSVIKQNNIYHIWYEGNNGAGYRIGHASSSNGIDNWNISSSIVLPVGTPDGWEKETRDPSVIYDPITNTYKMWYVSFNSDHWSFGLDRFRIRYATSADGINWNINSGWVLYGTSGTWDEGGIAHGLSVIKVNGTYKMWYGATNTNDEGSSPYWRIGYATSPDGINWTKQNNGNPVIESSEPWEEVNVSYPEVVYENGIYKMWYGTGSGDLPDKILYATSLDGIHWTKLISENPILTTSGNSFDSIWVSSPSVINDNGIYKMWYSGFNVQTGVSIGLATLDSSSPISLPVPSLKQTSPPWNTDIYDSANEWTPPTTYQTISDWGCALTSAVMVLQYHGITTMPHDPSHTPLDPRSLNNWLKSQPDGYALDPQGNKTGNVNWLAVSRLTRLAGLNPSDNPDFHYHALMYKPVHSANTALLTTDLSNNIPDILEEPGHFVVATGTQNGTYTINDPYYNNRPTLNDGYNNTFSSLGRFIPSLTDLSYIFLVAPTNVTVSIKDSQNNQVSDSFIQQPLENDTNPGHFNGSPIQEIYAATPSAGIYHMDISGSSSTPFTIQAYLYDINGNVKLATLSGNITPPAHSDFVINFNKQDVSQSIIQTITFGTTINDVKYYQNNNEVAFGIGQALIALLQSAQKDTAKGNTTVAKIKLDVTRSLLNILNTFRNEGISETAYQTLLTDINSLKTQL